MNISSLNKTDRINSLFFHGNKILETDITNILTGVKVIYPRLSSNIGSNSQLTKYRKNVDYVINSLKSNKYILNDKYLKLFKNPLREKLYHKVFETAYSYNYGSNIIDYLMYLILKDMEYVNEYNFKDFHNLVNAIDKFLNLLESEYSSQSLKSIYKNIEHSICTRHLIPSKIPNQYSSKFSSANASRQVTQFSYAYYREDKKYTHQYHEFNTLDTKTFEFYKNIIYFETVDFFALFTYFMMNNPEFTLITDELQKITEILNTNNTMFLNNSNATKLDCISIIVKYSNFQFNG